MQDQSIPSKSEADLFKRMDRQKGEADRGAQFMDQISVSRRQFIKATSAGIVFFFFVGKLPAFALEGEVSRPHVLPTDFNAFLAIRPDGRVDCTTGKIEMGQGIYTGLAQMLAEELDVALDSVNIIMGDTDLCPWDMGTWGSLSTRVFGPALRAAGAEARMVLLELASEQLKIPLHKLGVENGVIFDKSNPQTTITYAQLAQGKKIERHLSGSAAPKPIATKKPSEFKVMGKSTLRRDGRLKVTGEAKYAGDIHFPEMFHAKILRPPYHGAKLLKLDLSQAKSVSGAHIVQDGMGFIAVLHRSPEVALRALSRIKATYEQQVSKTDKALVDQDSIFEHLLSGGPKGTVVAESRNLERGQKSCTTLFEYTYLNAYVAHAPIEPHTATLQFDGKKATVWASTQTPFTAGEEAAKILGIPVASVHVMPIFVGGAFGGKAPGLQIIEAARCAKLFGKPVAVQVAWSREEEFFNDTFRPAAVVKIKSGIHPDGRIGFWDYSVFFAGDRGAGHFYTIPDSRVQSIGNFFETHPGIHPFSVGAWRAPGNNTNTFARESQIDIMASKAGIDPLEFRRQHLSDPKMQGVLKAAAETFGWKPAKGPSGRGYGIACGIDAGSHIAVMVEVKVDKASGKIRVLRAVAAQNMGLIVNPKGAKIQIEGCINMGLGYALTEMISFKGGEILDNNFDTYKIPRFSWIPKIETVLIEDQNSPPQGGGEPAIITMGAAIANAVFDATGARLFQLPMTPERVKEALTKK